jgi:hypothetical protein
MGIGISLFFLAAGAILAFAVDVQADGANLDTIGVILMIVGGIGLLASMLFWSDDAPMRRRRTYVEGDREVVREREVL